MPADVPPRRKRVLVTGATGFVGSHLLDVLVARGYEVIGGARDPAKASARRPDVRFRRVDLASPESVSCALTDVDCALYLVHAMGSAANYPELERRYAETFRDEAAARGVERIVYLGGMRPLGAVSRHLRSRLETGDILRSGRVPVVELQATMVIGGGSESFRIVRDLSARLPGMVLPSWLRSVSEPVAVDDVTAALACAVEMPVRDSVVLRRRAPRRSAVAR
jgi:uncharacterized protein YbjT (DUF2867 family)